MIAAHNVIINIIVVVLMVAGVFVWGVMALDLIKFLKDQRKKGK